MANFSTHIQFASVGSGLLSTLCLSTHVINSKEALLCWLAGTVGGILPDIDSDNSYSLTILFGLLSAIFCALATATAIHHLSLPKVWALCLLVFLATYVVLRKIFEVFTVHRGIFHSVLAALFFMFLTSSLASRTGLSASVSWFVGGFTFLGYLMHLLLDEIYAVDFSNLYIKRSFGSALKLFDYSCWKTSLAFTFAVALVFIGTPSHNQFAQVVFNSQTYTLFAQKIFG